MITSPAEIESLAFSRWGITPKRVSKEWHSPCPFCGGRDRFIIFSDGGYWCRPGDGHCGAKGWLDDDQKPPTPEKLAAWKANAEAAEARRQADIARRLAEFKTQAEQMAYRLGRDDERRFIAREYFRSEGISDKAIEFYGLGYEPSHAVEYGGKILHYPAYTIPIRDVTTWEIVNMQYRLKGAPLEVGKYRQHAGIPAASFFAERGRKDGDVLVVEGSKKAIVLYEFVGGNVQVVGLPGNTPREGLVEQLKTFNRVYLMLDPKSEAQAERMARILGARARVVAMQVKPDDAIVRYGLTAAGLRAHLACARRGRDA